MNNRHFLQIRARVCEASQEHYLLRCEDGSERAAVPTGELRWCGELPAVGDWVVARWADHSLAVIESVEPRSTCITRQRPGGAPAAARPQVLAANVDLICIIMGLDGDFNLRRLARYLVQATASGADVLVVLNKRDLCPQWQLRLTEVRLLAKNVIAISACESVALIKDQVRQRTVVLLGSSGAGKSTIANGLLGELRQATGAVRAEDSRGRHTTTHRMLMELPTGGVLIDTPGLREVGLWADANDVDGVYPIVNALAQGCHFRNCSHGGEPGCAITAALASGSLHAEDWFSYQKLSAEARYSERRQNQQAALEEKQRWKQIHKAQRQHHLRKGRDF
jgi:ribosome biogenesis GTPase / thiamine phosphate phosphatase